MSMPSPAGPPPVTLPGVSSDAAGQIQYVLGQLQADVRVILTRLEAVPDHEQRLRAIEQRAVTSEQLQAWQTKLADQLRQWQQDRQGESREHDALLAAERAKSELARQQARRAMWATLGTLATALAGLLALIGHP